MGTKGPITKGPNTKSPITKGPITKGPHDKRPKVTKGPKWQKAQLQKTQSYKRPKVTKGPKWQNAQSDKRPKRQNAQKINKNLYTLVMVNFFLSFETFGLISTWLIHNKYILINKEGQHWKHSFFIFKTCSLPSHIDILSCSVSGGSWPFQSSPMNSYNLFDSRILVFKMICDCSYTASRSATYPILWGVKITLLFELIPTRVHQNGLPFVGLC